MRRTRRWASAFAVLAILTSVAACGDDGGSESAVPSGPKEPKRGGNLIYGGTSEVVSLRSFDLKGNQAGEDRGAFIYDTLLLASATGEILPNMASSMESTDGKVWTLRLRSNIKFTDGTALDADAVKFNIELHKDPKNASTQITEVQNLTLTVVDPLTLRMELPAANGGLPYSFTRMVGMMMSPTAYRADPVAFGTKPVAAGPFTVQSWVKDSALKLVRNPTYWDVPKPYLDAVEVRRIPDNTTRGQALASGTIDLAVNEAPVLRAIRDNPAFKDFTTNTSGGQSVVPNQSKAPNDDLRIRQAIQLAFDPKVANQALMQGSWAAEDLDCPPFSPVGIECNKDVWPKPDLTKAKDLVRQYTASGKTLGTYTVLVTNEMQVQAEYIQQTLRDIGITVAIRAMPTAEYITNLQGGAFEYAWVGQPPFVGPPVAYYRNLHSKMRFVQKGTPNTDIDRQMEAGLGALDPKARADANKAVQKYLVDQAVITWYAPWIGGVSGKVDVYLGDRYGGGGTFVPQDIWLDR